jgi:hypothetical protein
MRHVLHRGEDVHGVEERRAAAGDGLVVGGVEEQEQGTGIFAADDVLGGLPLLASLLVPLRAQRGVRTNRRASAVALDGRLLTLAREPRQVREADVRPRWTSRCGTAARCRFFAGGSPWRSSCGTDGAGQCGLEKRRGGCGSEGCSRDSPIAPSASAPASAPCPRAL